MIYIVAIGVGSKCLRKIHLNTQWGGGTVLPTRFRHPCNKYYQYHSHYVGVGDVIAPDSKQ